MLENSPIIRLNTPEVNIDQIRKEAHEFMGLYPLRPAQVCLNDTGRAAEFDPYEGIGSAFDYDGQRMKFNERDFLRWAPSLQNSELLKSIGYLKERGAPLGRARLMMLKARSCYSFHQDATERIHLVIDPEPQAVMLFLPSTMLRIPYDRRFYLVDTKRVHSAMNGGLKDRLHLVIALQESLPE